MYKILSNPVLIISLLVIMIVLAVFALRRMYRDDIRDKGHLSRKTFTDMLYLSLWGLFEIVIGLYIVFVIN